MEVETRGRWELPFKEHGIIIREPHILTTRSPGELEFLFETMRRFQRWRAGRSVIQYHERILVCERYTEKQSGKLYGHFATK